MDEEVLNLLVVETNRYAMSLLTSNISPHSRLKKWEEVTIDEIKTFLGILLWMGLSPQPTLASYWTKDTLYASNIPDFVKIKRFELILRNFHCCNNNMCPPGDRLYKIKELLDMLMAKYKFACSPKESMCIDESIVPFVGRLSFKQYIQNKRHRYGIKIF